MSFQAQGMRAWMLQRLTAVYIAFYLLWLIVMIFNPGETMNYVSWKSLFSSHTVLIATMLFYFSVFIHAWVGIRDILVDYIQPTWLRFMLLTGLFVLLAIMSAWLLIILVSMVN